MPYLVTAGFVLTMSLLIVGFYQYFKRQYKDYTHITGIPFIFGTSKCRRINLKFKKLDISNNKINNKNKQKPLN